MQVEQLLVLVLWTCLSTLLDVTLLGDVVSASLVGNDDKRPDLLFPNTTIIFNAKLTCENTVPSGGTFPTETWSCYNMKINGNRLRYAFLSGFGTERSDSNGIDERNKLKNDFGAICQHLLRLHGINKDLWAAFVDEISHKKSPGPRMMLVANSNRVNYEWQEFAAGKGYVITLRCMTVA